MENTMREDEPQLFIDFMEMQISKQVMHDTRIYYHVKHQYNDSLIASEDQFLFDKSFDWLMPVVEKISSMGFEVKIITLNQGADYYNKPTNSSYRCSISKCYWKDNHFHKEFIKGRNDTVSLIDSTYRAVVEFIKWYQQTVTPKE